MRNSKTELLKIFILFGIAGLLFAGCGDNKGVSVGLNSETGEAAWPIINADTPMAPEQQPLLTRIYKRNPGSGSLLTA